MSGDYLLDTNVVIALINGEPAVSSRLSGSLVSVPLIAVGELEYGARNSGRPQENLQRLAQFVSGVSVLLPDRDTASWYGQVRHGLKVKGRPIPENDVWIAALARQHDLTLVSRDAHFNDVDALRLEVW